MRLEDHFHWLTPTLAVGDFYAATPPFCWHTFSAILNCCESEHEGMSDTYNSYLWLPFSDGDGRVFGKRLPVGLRFLKRHQDTKTLVHCMAGASRSVAIALAHLSRQAQTDSTAGLASLFADIQTARPCAYPAQVFVDVIAQRLQIDPPQCGW